MIWLRDLRLALKIPVIAALAITAGLGVALLVSLTVQIGVLSQSLARSTQQEASMLAWHSRAALSFEDPDAALHTLEALSSQQGVRLACVLDDSGAEFACLRPDPTQHGFSILPLPGTYEYTLRSLVVSQPVLLAQSAAPIGVVVIERDLTAMLRVILLESLATLLGLAAAFALALVILSRLQRIITQPLRLLSQAARRVVEEGDLSVQVQIEGRDELGSLVKAFNHMIRDLDAQRADLVEAKLRAEEHASSLEEALEAQTHLEQELVHARKMESVGRLAGGVAHDFNNLLTAIMGNAELARLELHDGEIDALGHNLDQISEASRQAASVTQQLLAFARKQMVQPELVSLAEIVPPGAKLLRRLLPESISVRVELDPNTSPVCIDPGQVQQVLMNLGVNARDAMPDGGVIIIRTEDILVQTGDITTQDGPLAPGSYVALSVQDSGVGIPGEILDKLFDPFFTTKARGSGTGLGLATCYGIAHQAGGSILVDSTPGLGSTFTLVLPASEARPGASEDEPASAPSVPSTGSILLVEDEEAVRQVLEGSLRQRGYEVTVAADPLTALQLVSAKGKVFDLLITDVIMPHMNGWELATECATHQSAMRVLYISGYTDDLLPTEVGAGQFLEKPFTPEALCARIQSILELGQHPEEDQ